MSSHAVGAPFQNIVNPAPEPSMGLKIRVWAANHPLAARVIVACIGILVMGGVALGLFFAGMPYGLPVLLPALFFLPATLRLMVFPSAEQIQRDSLITNVQDQRNGELYPVSTHDLKLVTQLMSPDAFRRKMEQEILQQADLFNRYDAICNSLAKAHVRDEFFGPLPRLKERFIERFHGVPCSRFMDSTPHQSFFTKAMLSNLVKSHILSDGEANLIERAHEIQSRYDGLIADCQKINAALLESGSDSQLAALVEQQRAELLLIDTEFESIRQRI